MAPLDDEARSMLLFPTFPTGQWDVRFKMHAPLNTTVEASCQGALACNSECLNSLSFAAGDSSPESDEVLMMLLLLCSDGSCCCARWQAGVPDRDAGGAEEGFHDHELRAVSD